MAECHVATEQLADAGMPTSCSSGAYAGPLPLARSSRTAAQDGERHGPWSAHLWRCHDLLTAARLCRRQRIAAPLGDNASAGFHASAQAGIVLRPRRRRAIGVRNLNDEVLMSPADGYYPDLPAAIAISADGLAAGKALRDFRSGDRHCILVAVRMAFIGYDKPEISVIGLLTHYRPKALRELMGRGLRVSRDGPPVHEQSARSSAPTSPDGKVRETRKSRDRTRLERTGNGPGPSPPTASLWRLTARIWINRALMVPDKSTQRKRYGE